MCHGDDVDIEINSVSKAVALMDQLDYYGFDVSKEKTSISTIELPKSEFLKTVSLPKSLHGYASRMAGACLYNKPWTHSNRMDYDHNSGRFVDAGFLDPNSAFLNYLEMYR